MFYAIFFILCLAAWLFGKWVSKPRKGSSGPPGPRPKPKARPKRNKAVEAEIYYQRQLLAEGKSIGNNSEDEHRVT